MAKHEKRRKKKKYNKVEASSDIETWYSNNAPGWGARKPSS